MSVVAFTDCCSTSPSFTGTLLIVPAAGALCARTNFLGGWPSIFYVSALTGLFFVLIYVVVGADKPSKQGCISNGELKFITVANTCEDVGKKRIERRVPWKRILLSGPVWAALISVVCHEFPLMTMIMFLPRYGALPLPIATPITLCEFSYLHDVHHYSPTENGILSALPTACLWISKIGSSYLNTWMQEKTSWKISTISKVLNGVGSVGLALFMVAATFLDATCAYLAVVFLCFSMLFTGSYSHRNQTSGPDQWNSGMHTPGCQAALVAVAPAFSGAITGLTFFFVAISGMINPAMTKWIVVVSLLLKRPPNNDRFPLPEWFPTRVEPGLLRVNCDCTHPSACVLHLGLSGCTAVGTRKPSPHYYSLMSCNAGLYNNIGGNCEHVSKLWRH